MQVSIEAKIFSQIYSFVFRGMIIIGRGSLNIKGVGSLPSLNFQYVVIKFFSWIAAFSLMEVSYVEDGEQEMLSRHDAKEGDDFNYRKLYVSL